jgi:hypothetical protein
VPQGRSQNCKKIKFLKKILNKVLKGRKLESKRLKSGVVSSRKKNYRNNK